MKLIVSGNTIAEQPTDLDITRALSELASGEHEYVTLDDSARNTLAQVTRAADGSFVLEVIDNLANNRLRSLEHFIDSTTVTNVFLSILEGDGRWRAETQWGVAETNVTTGVTNSRSSLIAIVMALAILAAGIAMFFAQSGG